MNTPAATPFPADEWMMGGSKDAEANAALGFTEAEAAQTAVEAYQYAWSKVRGGHGDGMRAMAVHELASELAYQLCEHLGLTEDETE